MTATMERTKGKKGGNGRENIRFAIGDSPLGLVLVAGSAKGICAILLGDDRRVLEEELRHRFPHAELTAAGGACAALLSTVLKHLEEPARAPDIPLDERGTEFQRRVWQALREIPPGETTTYKEIAGKIGAPAAVRAVAGAIAANPLAILTPCHRVIRSDGGLAGYRWGVERKKRLLARERQSSKA